MAGIVLALAGLASSDGGPGMRAAPAPARSFAGRWKGMFYAPELDLILPVEWDNGRGELTHEGQEPIDGCYITPVGGGRVRLTHRGRPTLRTCDWRGGQVRIYLREEGAVLILRPAPRKS